VGADCSEWDIAHFRPEYDAYVRECDWNECLMWKWIKRWETAVPDTAKDIVVLTVDQIEGLLVFECGSPRGHS
jgi:hypothetical protein